MKAFKRDTNEYVILALNTVDDALVFKHAGIKPLKYFIGYYKGHKESSYLLPLNKESLDLAKAFNQESVLILHAMENGKRPSSLMYLSDSQLEFLGNFTAVNKPNSYSYTLDVESGLIYEAIKEKH